MSSELKLPHFEDPKKFFEHKECRIKQMNYLMAHPEIKALLRVFIAEMTKSPVDDPGLAWLGINMNSYVALRKTGEFFCRDPRILQSIADEELGRREEYEMKPSAMKAYETFQPPDKSTVKDTVTSATDSSISANVSFDSIYSTFVTESTSATTVSEETYVEPPSPSLQEFMHETICRALDKGLNFMYESREDEVIYDEAFLCVVLCIDDAVKQVWRPFLEEIDMLFTNILSDVREISLEHRRNNRIIANRMPVKVDRLRQNFKGFEPSLTTLTDSEAELTSERVKETIQSRSGTYNRYSKDLFGVYLSTDLPSLAINTVTNKKNIFSIANNIYYFYGM